MTKFIRLGRGNKLNDTLVDKVVVSKNRYFVKDIYGGSYEVDEKHFKEIVKILGKDIVKEIK